MERTPTHTSGTHGDKEEQRETGCIIAYTGTPGSAQGERKATARACMSVYACGWCCVLGAFRVGSRCGALSREDE